jgi:hypothetical protein
MRTWMNDGQPMEDGRMCLIIDPENGTQPIRVWGRSKDEILEKAAKTVEHGARTISELRSKITPSSTPAASSNPAPQIIPPRQPALSVEETMRLTADLANPAKAPAAVTRLIEAETGLDLKGMKRQATMERIAHIQAQWSISNPDFPKHPVNYRLLNDAAALRVGYENITAEVMDTVFHELSSQGLLLPPAEDEPEPTTPTVPPEENPALRTVRPRGAASLRRAITSPPPLPASHQPKYTRAQIDGMTSAEYRRRMETEPGFSEAVAALAQPGRATA